MKFITSKESILEVITLAQDVIANKSAISILSNVMFETDKENNKIIVKCTNTTVKAIATFGADIYEEGSTTVFCDKLFSIITSLPLGDIEFESVENEIIIKPLNKKVRFKIKSLASEKFPIINRFNSDNAIEIPGKDLKKLIKNTTFAVSTDKSRYIMTGCYITKKDNLLIMVATDGRRMSTSSCVDFNMDIKAAIVPIKIFSIIEKYASDEGNVLISTTDKEFYFKGNWIELSSSLIDGDYPNWNKVLPVNLDHTITVSKKDLEEAIKRTGIMSDKNGRIQLFIDKGKMTITSPESESGSSDEEINAIYDMENTTISLNLQYLSDVLKVINGNNISLDFKFNQEGKVTSAIIVRSDEENKNYTHVIMPMNY